jgi:hypothetical protein
MPRNLGGRTELGRQINKQSQSIGHVKIDKLNIKRAILYKSYNNTYVFFMKLIEDRSITRPIPLLGSADELAMRYGSPSEMENQWEVSIYYKGNSVNRGYAQVVGKVGNTMGAVIEESEQSNQLNIKGTAFAPPGGGMV